MTMTPLQLYSASVPSEWLDYNGHMNDACYAVAFSQATDRLIEHIGLDAAYREQKQRSIYTLENHICYLHEAGRGEQIRMTTQLLEYDAKRLRLFHALYRDDVLLATSEQMLLHVDSSVPQASPFDRSVAEQVEQLAQAHEQLPMPAQAGRAIMQLRVKG